MSEPKAKYPSRPSILEVLRQQIKRERKLMYDSQVRLETFCRLEEIVKERLEFHEEQPPEVSGVGV